MTLTRLAPVAALLVGSVACAQGSESVRMALTPAQIALIFSIISNTASLLAGFLKPGDKLYPVVHFIALNWHLLGGSHD